MTACTMILSQAVTAKCVSWAKRNAGFSTTNKACTYTFTANTLTDSQCFKFYWYKNGSYVSSDKSYTYTFNTNGYSTIKLIIKNKCDTTCSDTFISKTVQYSCASKCNWYKKNNLGWSYGNKGCDYTFEANNLNDTCMSYEWLENGKTIGTGRVLKMTFGTNGYTNLCLKIKDNCNSCDTSICKKIQYSCASKCNWYKKTNLSWSYGNKGCDYTFEANNLRDSCIKYYWKVNGVGVAIGRVLNYTFNNNDSNAVCLVLYDTCNKCDTSLCKTIKTNCKVSCNWGGKTPGFGYGNKGCDYTFEANNMFNTCMKYEWLDKGKVIGTGRILKLTFNTNGYSNICLKVSDTCNKCDTTICKTIQYNCASKCNWHKRTNLGWSYNNKGCTYTFESNNLKDSCIKYYWSLNGKGIATGRLLTYTFKNNDTNKMCMVYYDTCNKCDTSICKTIITKCNTTSTQSFGLDETTIYPNPVDQVLTIKVKGQQAVSMVLFDSKGREVSIRTTRVGDQYTISTRDIASGVYSLRMSSGEEQLSHKLIIQH
jgi:hypothetical protein